MARKFLSALDLNKNELQNVALQNLASAPSAPATGQIYFNTSDKTHYVYSGTAWLKFVPSGSISNADIASDASIALSKLATDPLARANHTGTQASSTISDLATTVKAYRLDEFASPSSSVSLNSQKITGLADPTNAQDAATKAYVDAAQLGLDVKPSVKVATTEAITLSGTQTVDGIALSVGDRVLVKNQGTGSQNGLYTVAEESWVRTTDADTSAEVTPGLFVFVEQGTSNADSGWVLTTDGTITLGTTALTFVQFSGAGQVVAGTGLTKTGNTLDVVGTADRITSNSDSIDIASTYVGQSSITTLGTISSGTWNGTTIGVAHGGTGATTLTGYVKGDGTNAFTASSTIPGSDISGNISGNAANVSGTVAVANGGTGATTLGAGGYLKGNGTSAITSQTGVPFSDVTGTVPVNQGGTGATTSANARTNLSSTSFALPQKYSVKNSSLTQSSGVVTWTIDATTHGLGTDGTIIVQMKEVATGAVVEADILISESTGDITVSWNSASNVTANTYRITAIG
jgi:hypothetical protein